MEIKTNRIELIEKELGELNMKIIKIDKLITDWIGYYKNHLEREHKGVQKR